MEFTINYRRLLKANFILVAAFMACIYMWLVIGLEQYAVADKTLHIHFISLLSTPMICFAIMSVLFNLFLRKRKIIIDFQKRQALVNGNRLNLKTFNHMHVRFSKWLNAYEFVLYSSFNNQVEKVLAVPGYFVNNLTSSYNHHLTSQLEALGKHHAFMLTVEDNAKSLNLEYR